MVMGRRGLGRAWRPGLAGAVGLGLLVLLAVALPVAAQDAGGGAGWQTAMVSGGGTSRLYTPTSGALFASGLFSGLRRSNDGGRTWRPVPLAAGPEKRITGDIPEVVIG